MINLFNFFSDNVGRFELLEGGFQIGVSWGAAFVMTVWVIWAKLQKIAKSRRNG